MMKKVCIFLCMLFCILSESIAVGASVTIDDFSCNKIVNKKIFGSFEINNLDGNYYNKLNYILYLVPEKNLNEGNMNIMSLAESKASSF